MGKYVMASATCAHCGSEIEIYGDQANFEGPVPCVACHKSTWISVDDGRVTESQKWPAA